MYFARFTSDIPIALNRAMKLWLVYGREIFDRSKTSNSQNNPSTVESRQEQFLKRLGQTTGG